MSLSWQTPWNKVFKYKVINPPPINLQLILNQPQGHPTISGHQFTTSAIFPDFKHLTATHSIKVLISLSETFKISEIDVNNELSMLQFWQTFNILHGVGVSRKETFNFQLGIGNISTSSPQLTSQRIIERIRVTSFLQKYVCILN